ncbi:hypothetical protein JTE90_005200 [Oedothorax gibbosus]|uniref:Uncharacterized protein n=1 Tax=Oedothorax gibbosus TaxID=931172 RepID=A0AAV6ULT2_9ARAC|nr:hypothetical protein JTE90_005200 [Oedothorax gibbosus]
MNARVVELTRKERNGDSFQPPKDLRSDATTLTLECDARAAFSLGREHFCAAPREHFDEQSYDCAKQEIDGRGATPPHHSAEQQ